MAKKRERKQISFSFNPDAIARPDRPPDDAARLIWLFLSLIRKHEIRIERYLREFARGEKTFQRDLAKLRQLGSSFGFELTPLKNGIVYLGEIQDMPDDRKTVRAFAADTIRALCNALGTIISNDLEPYLDTSMAPLDPFLRVAAPRLLAQSDVAARYKTLREAWLARATVRFRYPAAGDGALEERTVEPHLVTYLGGRFYLVAFDRRPRTFAWRQFALDRIDGTIAHAGTFSPRTVPAPYRGEDAIGLFKSQKSTLVTIELSPRIAAAVCAREWKRGQTVAAGRAGWTALTFEVHDLDEAVRWAMGFGRHARIVAPAEAVTIATETAEALLRQYAPAAQQIRVTTA